MWFQVDTTTFASWNDCIIHYLPSSIDSFAFFQLSRFNVCILETSERGISDGISLVYISQRIDKVVFSWQISRNWESIYLLSVAFLHNLLPRNKAIFADWAVYNFYFRSYNEIQIL